MVNRRPLQVDPDFKKKLLELRIRLIKKLGDERKVSYTKITKEMSKTNIFDQVEEMLLRASDVENVNLKLKLDRRIK